MANVDQFINQANDNRRKIQQTGDNLNNYENNQANYYGNLNDSYRGQADTAYSDLAQNPGYTAPQAAAITGNPNAAMNYYHPDQLSGDVNANASDLNSKVGDYGSGLTGAAGQMKGDLTGAAGHLDTSLHSAADSAASTLKAAPDTAEGYMGGVYGYLKGQNDSAVGGYGRDLADSTDPSKLGLSSDFQNNYKMTPEEQQNIKDVAAQTTGGQFKAMQEQAEINAAAEGNTSPVALAAMQQQLGRSGAIAAGDAASKAEMGANAEAANRLQTAEGMRIGTQQDIATRQAQNAGNLYSAKTGAASNLASLEQGGIQSVAGLRQAGANTAATLGYDAAATGGQAGIDAAKTGDAYGYTAADSGGQAQVNASQYNGQQKLATDTGNQVTGENLAATADNTASGRAKGIADTGIAGQDKVRNYYTGEQGAAQQGAETAGSQAIQNAGVTAGAVNQATATGAQAAQAKDNKPGLFSKIVGAGVGAAGAAAPFFADGGIATKPTEAIIGERGPEMVVPLGKFGRYGQPRAPQMPPPMKARRYGSEYAAA